MLKSLEEAGLDPATVSELWQNYRQARQHESKAKFGTEGEAGESEVPADLDQAGAGSGALGLIGRLLIVLRMMYGQHQHDAVVDPFPSGVNPGVSDSPLGGAGPGGPQSGSGDGSNGGLAGCSDETINEAADGSVKKRSLIPVDSRNVKPCSSSTGVIAPTEGEPPVERGMCKKEEIGLDGSEGDNSRTGFVASRLEGTPEGSAAPAGTGPTLGTSCHRSLADIRAAPQSDCVGDYRLVIRREARQGGGRGERKGQRGR